MRLFWIVTAVNISVGLANLAGLYIWTLPSHTILSVSKYDPKYYDAMQAAMSLGRLDGISILLAIIGVNLGILAMFGFGYIRFRSEQVARETADKVSKAMFLQWSKDKEQDSRDTEAPASTIDPQKVDVASASVDEEDESEGEQ